MWSPAPIITLLAVYSRLSKGKRARVIVVNKNNEVLLVKGLIGRHAWELPGGAIKKGEEAAVAAARELYEETGIVPPTPLESMGEVKIDGYTAVLFKLKLDDAALRGRTLEIRDIQWFPMSDLPQVGNDTKKLILQIGDQR